MQTQRVPISHPEEDELIRRTLAGHKNAFASLILRYKDSLFDMATRILGNRTEAEDVLQDAFLQAYKHLPDFNHQSRFSTWMYSIVLNRVRNHLRHNKVIRWSSLDIQSTEDSDYRAPEIPEKGPTFHAAMESRLDLELVQQEVKFLPVLYQTIFTLHYFQEMSLEEVSERLSRPIGTIKVYLHRARKLLYKRIQMRTSPVVLEPVGQLVGA